MILLDVSTAASQLRYVRRALFEPNRVGGLEGGRDSVEWSMVHHIAVITRANRRRHDGVYRQFDLPKIRLAGARNIERFYRTEKLGSHTDQPSASYQRRQTVTC